MEDKQITCKSCGALNTPLILTKVPNNGPALNRPLTPCGCQKAKPFTMAPSGMFQGATLEW